MTRAAAPPALDLGALALLLARTGAMLYVLHAGFAQVSDDDYARTVIAESFAHAPRLDPSGTSWLPLPFWLTGATMMAFGRSLATARGLAFVLGTAAPLVLYGAMRAVQVPRISALLGAGLAALTPWSVWLGVATVPEGWAGLLAAAALVLLADRRPAALTAAGAFSLVAALSRYEAWPIAAMVACVAGWRAMKAERGERRGLTTAAALAALGPLAWMAWNAHAHGSPVHFLARVTNYRKALGGGGPLVDRLLAYPRAALDGAPEIPLAAIPAVLCLRSRAFRARWALPLAGALLVMVFLVAGDLADAAPTHHPARAMMTLFAVLACAGADGARTLVVAGIHGRPGREAWLVAAVVIGGVAWLSGVAGRWREVPGNGPTERRDAQIDRGLELRARGVPALEVTPCRYEHFALIAAFGEPEKVTVGRGTGREVSPVCPEVRER